MENETANDHCNYKSCQKQTCNSKYRQQQPVSEKAVSTQTADNQRDSQAKLASFKTTSISVIS